MQTGAPLIHVIAVCYRKFGQLQVFVQSWLNQTADNWILTVIHDGPDEQFNQIMAAYTTLAPAKVRFAATNTRVNDFGHTLRDLGLKAAEGDYVLLTNADNYFVPRAVEFINQAFVHHHPDVVIFDMVHSHNRPGGRPLPPYAYFETAYARGAIDISAALVRRPLAQQAGFRDKSHDGDASYFEDVAKTKAPAPLSIIKVPQILFVHN